MNLLGIFLAVGVIILANIIEGGHPSAMLNLPAFLIVIGGAFVPPLSSSLSKN